MADKENLDINPSKDKKAGRGKRGVLSNPERKFIEENAPIMSIKEISKKIGKSSATIRKYIYKNNIPSKEVYGSNADQKVEAKNVLHSRDYWVEIKKQFSQSEQKVFENHWIDLYIQFQGDILAAEELQVKKYISLEILKDRYSKKAFQLAQEADKLHKMLEEQYALPAKEQNPDAIKVLYNQLDKLEANQLDFLKEYRELTDRQKQTEKDLKVSRDQRIKNINDATENWTTAIKLLNDNAEVRNNVAKHIEIMKAAKDKQKDILYDWHNFLDKSLDKPVLNAESVEEQYYNE